MAAPSKPAEELPIDEPTEAEVDALIAEAGGDARQAIKFLLHDLVVLALDTEVSVSRGFVRSKLLPFRLERLG